MLSHFVTRVPSQPIDRQNDRTGVVTEVQNSEVSPHQSNKEFQSSVKQSKPASQRQWLLSTLFRRTEQSTKGVDCGFGSFRTIDITQSKWRPDGKDREIVTLDIKPEDDVIPTARRSFRWIHHQRAITPMAFSEFQRHIETGEGLYYEELAIATRCLEEIRRERKQSARGRYFESTVHRATVDYTDGEQQAPLSATFISIPIFARLQSTTGGAYRAVYPSSQDMQNSDVHPVRSLLQYSNILAVDDVRDHSQVITKMDLPPSEAISFIHVPELWALSINMYTLITCCPLSVAELCGENILLKFPVDSPAINKTGRDTRTIVKYTDYRGRLVDLECRQWQTLVDYISRVEADGDEARRIELGVMLKQPDSDYKIVDRRFQPVDRARWIDIVDSQYDKPEFVHLRLVQVRAGEVLNLAFAARQHQTFQLRTLVLSASRLYLEVLRNRLIKASRNKAGEEILHALKNRVQLLRRRINRLHRSRLLSRFMLYAARYRLMTPQRRMSLDHDTRPDLKQAAVRQSRFSRPQRDGRSLSRLWNCSPQRSQAPLTLTIPQAVSAPGMTDTGFELPRIVVSDEAGSIPRASGSSLSQARRSESVTQSTYESLRLGEDVEAQWFSGTTDRDALTGGATHRTTFRDDTAFEPMALARRESEPQQLRKPTSSLRRHNSIPSPLRRPLHAEDDAALRIGPRQTTSGRRTAHHSSLAPPTIDERSESIASTTSSCDMDSYLDHNFAVQAERRVPEAVRRLTPFFEWETGLDQPLDDRLSPILDFIDSLLSQDAIGMFYAEIEPRSVREVIRRLETEASGLDEARQRLYPSSPVEAEYSFYEAKVELFMSTYGVLRCFLRLDEADSPVVAKVWGILFELCDLPTRETRPATIHRRHEIKFVIAAAEQMHKLQVEVSDLLKDTRPDVGRDDTAVTYKICRPLVHVFVNIVSYLIRVWQATTQFGFEAEDLGKVVHKAHELLAEAELAFVRMKSHAELYEDRFTGTESIKTAETLLALLIENAMEMSNGNSTIISGSPRFDLRYVYSKYTYECIIPSARIYKEVKLLVEELETVMSILEHQREVVHNAFRERESPLQEIDQRVRQRTADRLDHLTVYFERLLRHARQAADWNQHFVNVRSEENNKTVFIFTIITVVFLPLSFVAGLLGMNTKDIRESRANQGLFWAIAIPFTFGVLVVCAWVVGYRIAVRRRVNAMLRRCFRRSY